MSRKFNLSTFFRTLFRYQILYLQIVTYYVQIQPGTYSPNINAIVYGYSRFGYKSIRGFFRQPALKLA